MAWNLALVWPLELSSNYCETVSEDKTRDKVFSLPSTYTCKEETVSLTFFKHSLWWHRTSFLSPAKIHLFL